MKEKGNNLRYILKSKFIFFTLGMILLKLILMSAFSSDYQNKMFLPFVQGFLRLLVSGSDSNIYEYYYRNNLLSSFPYPPLMLYITSLAYVWIEIFHIKSVFIINPKLFIA